ncbi:hypothetical protein [Candidatus Uabimicrobium sp. HlEnr_7]|uniref:hypothetical protein n=1 Tax=Candidatus Uabimicrobium helgolandensis TaxID=3095367 RepID=UPI003557D21C
MPHDDYEVIMFSTADRKQFGPFLFPPYIKDNTPLHPLNFTKDGRKLSLETVEAQYQKRQENPNNLILYIRDIAGDVTDGDKESDENNKDFSLTWVKKGKDLIAQVEVQKERIFSYEAEKRQALKESFDSFCLTLEKLEHNKRLRPGGLRLAINRIASSLPLLFSEILPYMYSFNRESRYINLVPGMRLAVHYNGNAKSCQNLKQNKI